MDQASAIRGCLKASSILNLTHSLENRRMGDCAPSYVNTYFPSLASQMFLTLKNHDLDNAQKWQSD